jgi:hypothetical protein
MAKGCVTGLPHHWSDVFQEHVTCTICGLVYRPRSLGQCVRCSLLVYKEPGDLVYGPLMHLTCRSEAFSEAVAALEYERDLLVEMERVEP